MKNMISENFYRCPEVSGPVPTSEKSHPFCAMKYSREPLDLREYGYVEEEFFLTGKACVYDADPDDEAVACGEALPYKTRILARRPSDEKAFSGRVYFDIMNATQGYDIEDLWHRIYLWCMENGHGYVGITSKPVNVMSLKNFDYERYGSLNWGNGQPVDMPVPSNSATIPGTEEGLIWDMLGQTGVLLRSGGNKVMGGFRTPYVDVPIASYTACNPDDPEGICGKMEYFSKDLFTETYKDRESYLRKFADAVERQVKEGWLSITDGNKMKKWAAEVSLQYA